MPVAAYCRSTSVLRTLTAKRRSRCNAVTLSATSQAVYLNNIHLKYVQPYLNTHITSIK